ncbi:MAG: hypothetical protein GX427_01265 [Actinomycetales bacterium]|nr:hypothetical protein [Actinomycetales bacterium]
MATSRAAAGSLIVVGVLVGVLGLVLVVTGVTSDGPLPLPLAAGLVVIGAVIQGAALRVWSLAARGEGAAGSEPGAGEPGEGEPAVVETARGLSGVEAGNALLEPDLPEAAEPFADAGPLADAGLAEAAEPVEDPEPESGSGEGEPDVPHVVVDTAPRGVTSEIVATDAALAEIARQRAKPAETLTYFFVCCSNQSLIRSLYDLLRVAAPAHGGFAAMLAGDKPTIEAHRQEAGALGFNGRRHVIREVTEVGTVAEAMSAVQAAGYHDVFVAVAGMDQSGREQMEEMYRGLVRQAFRQGIMPFPMFETDDRRAAQFLVGACRKLAGDDLPGEQPGRHRA